MRFVVIIFFPFFLNAGTIDISIFSDNDFMSDILFKPETSNYILSCPKQSLEISKEDLLYISKSLHGYRVFTIDRAINFFCEELLFNSKNALGAFRISIGNDERLYAGDLIVTEVPNTKLINRVNLNEYVAGVIASEVGGVTNLDFLRVQAIIARTYAIKNINRHIEEGFSLCDLTHCQAYYSMSYYNNSDIINASVSSTSSILLTDKNYNLITSVFHSNCGGYTANSEDVWQIEKSYLRSIVDTFCLNEKNAVWYDTIAFRKDEKPICSDVLNRKKRYVINNDTLHLNEFRKTHKLPSTLFTSFCMNNKAYLSGRGYGHGVGLCQEGAIRMAELGYNFKEILFFYYTGVRLLSFENLE